MYSVIIDHLSEEQARELSGVLEDYIVSGNRLLQGASIRVQQCDDSEDGSKVEWPAEPVPFDISQSKITKDLVIEYFSHYSDEDIERLNTKSKLVDMFYSCYKAPPLSASSKADIVSNMRRLCQQCLRARSFHLIG